MRTFSLIIFIFLSISLFAKTETAVIYNANGTQTIRIPLNHESQNITQVNLRGAQAEKAFSLPIASRWIVLSAKLKLYYTSSITIIPERSSISVSFNNKTLTQKWINALDRGLNTNLETSLPAEDFENFNQITINSYQHYTIEHCEDETAPELWTKIDSKKSYVELVVLPKTLPNALSSIDHFLFDFKNISRQNIVFVLPPKRR
ncbi:MAG: cellulose biosynthesis cyclic di-GMP-binding regulatory protein BcsB, partial [Gammaproteobacteria bacterium]|nr:cellulose biosynthesis cyclic di-GMP-binding regulatory protein BcsB [Gammaproteobacteria bacterium]